MVLDDALLLGIDDGTNAFTSLLENNRPMRAIEEYFMVS